MVEWAGAGVGSQGHMAHAEGDHLYGAPAWLELGEGLGLRLLVCQRDQS